MKLLVAISALSISLFATAAIAQRAPQVADWCRDAQFSGIDNVAICGYATREQCIASRQGHFENCYPNPAQSRRR